MTDTIQNAVGWGVATGITLGVTNQFLGRARRIGRPIRRKKKRRLFNY